MGSLTEITSSSKHETFSSPRTLRGLPNKLSLAEDESAQSEVASAYKSWGYFHGWKLGYGCHKHKCWAYCGINWRGGAWCYTQRSYMQDDQVVKTSVPCDTNYDCKDPNNHCTWPACINKCNSNCGF